MSEKQRRGWRHGALNVLFASFSGGKVTAWSEAVGKELRNVESFI
jgi:hypothetical protein